MALDRNGGATGSGAPVTIPDAESDGTLYGRKDAAWVAVSAEETAFTPAGTLSSTTVQDAIEELEADVVAGSGLASHLSDTADAHDASAISFSPVGDLVATDVQAAIAEAASDAAGAANYILGVATDHIADTADAHDASAISFTPVGTIAATDVQAAIAEVASEAASTTVATDAIWATKGDIVVATGNNAAVVVPATTDGYVMTLDSAETAGVKWAEPGTTSAPTQQVFTSGSGTYTKPAGCTRIHVRMVGGGGGGGPGSSSSAAGGAGGNTTFGLHTASGGSGGTIDGVGGAGGSASIGSGAIGIGITGAKGSGADNGPAGDIYEKGGDGGNAPYFAGGGTSAYGTAGTTGVTNTGGGGGGGGTNGAGSSGAGGGSGGFCEFIISAPASTYSYAVGAAGTAGTGSVAGGAGAAGQIIVTEYYGNFDSVLQLNEPASTKQEFTSGSGTYTTPAGVNRIRVRMVAGGGGGEGGGVSLDGGNGGTGGNSTFGSSLLTTTGAAGGAAGVGGAGGTATVSSPAVGVAIAGTRGTANMFGSTGYAPSGSDGADAPFFGGGGAGGNSGVSAQTAVGNSGGGGGGGGALAVANATGGASGGSGGFVDAWIWNPSATYAYAVGAAGTAGTAGTSGNGAGAGAAGRIIVEEFYGPTHTVADTQPLSGWPGRNRIINGDFRIDQRNAGVATAATSSGTTYAADRWQAIEDTDGSFTTESDGASSPPPGFASYMRVTVTGADASLAAAQFAAVYQKIEGTNCADLDFGLSTAKTVTVSFRVRSSLTGTFSGSLRNSAQNRAYPFTYTISAANTWETKTVTIAGDTSGTWLTTTGIGITLTFSLGCGSNRLGTAGAWAASDLWGATGETPLIGTNGATWDITGVQLEAGSVRTEYERRAYDDEMRRCQRYYEICTTQTHAMVLTAATTTMYLPYIFKVTKRSAPTIVTPSSTNAAYSFSLGTITPTTWSGENATTESFRIAIGHASGVGGVLTGNVFTASAEL
jgi:hypothetical protein